MKVENKADEADFNVMNTIAEFKELLLVKISELKRNYLYTITAASKVKTKHRMSVTFHLNNAYSVFLNRRISKFFINNPKEFEDC